MRDMWFLRNYYRRKLEEKILVFIVWKLPKNVVMWAYIRVVSHATVGKYGSTIVPDLSAMDALKRWTDE